VHDNENENAALQIRLEAGRGSQRSWLKVACFAKRGLVRDWQGGVPRPSRLDSTAVDDRGCSHPHHSPVYTTISVIYHITDRGEVWYRTWCSSHLFRTAASLQRVFHHTVQYQVHLSTGALLMIPPRDRICGHEG